MKLDSAWQGGTNVEPVAYDRSQVVPGIVHIGVGNFHRSHQAMVVDRILAAGDLAWGISGVGLLAGDRAAADAARAQDGLYTLVTVEPDGTERARIIGSIVEYLYAPDDRNAVLDRLAAATTKIVTMTITEAGYGIDEAGEFRPNDPLVLQDLEAGGREPSSALGLLAEALRRRRDAGVAPFAVVSCDNIQGNGHVAKAALQGYAERIDSELAGWISMHVAFPSSMVDRITPGTTAETRSRVAEQFGVEDAWPVRAESFFQWVLEDSFVGGPDWAAAGVQLVPDVEPYELMKLRLLNASHQAMSYLGLLAGFEWVHEACRDENFAAFLLRYMEREARPTLRPVPGIDLEAYSHELLARFSNTEIRDTLLRQVVDGSERLGKFLLPVIREQLAAGGEIACSATVLAAWGLYIEGYLPAGEGTGTVQAAAWGGGELADLRAERLLAGARAEAAHPGALLQLTEVFGDLGQNERLVAAYQSARANLLARGAAAVVADLAAGK